VTRAWLVLLPALALACATTTGPPPLQPIRQRVDLQRFMGDWYVLASIPIDLPFVSEADSYDGVESYRLTDEGVIETTYTFRDGGFDGPLKTQRPKGFVHDPETNAEWRMQFIWPFKAAYLIVYLDDDYEQTIIGVPDRGHAWIMARTPSIPEDEYQALVTRLVELGYDVSKLRKVPQQWPAPNDGRRCPKAGCALGLRTDARRATRAAPERCPGRGRRSCRPHRSRD
jgi:apolipoprotein D and lipocalin family protein